MTVMKRGMPPGGVNPVPSKPFSQAFAVRMDEHGSQPQQPMSPAVGFVKQGLRSICIKDGLFECLCKESARRLWASHYPHLRLLLADRAEKHISVALTRKAAAM